ncbi:MAG: LD-carboxypeptidase, partial [Erysipelotrichaceae bacterium]|nr:LD-carboxypeptidase [Erysipelotrichaceae bacterium]
MIYPEFLKENDLIGICAPSKGVGHKLDELEESNEVLRQNGYRIKETKSVRKNSDRSASAKQRAREMEELICDPEVKAVLCAAGGDYMLEMMPYVDFDRIRENPKWIIGMSDPT